MADESSLDVAFYEWLPGAAAGLLPLSAFALAFATGEGVPIDHFDRTLASHLLVVAIVASTVSVITSFVRVASGNYDNFRRDGRGPYWLLMLLVGTSFYSTVTYTLTQAGADGLTVRVSAWLAVGTALSASFFMEVAMSRLRLLSARPERQQATPPDVDQDESP